MEAAEIKQLTSGMLLRPLPHEVYEQLGRYVQLLMRWNGRMNLTAVRDPRVLVALHVGECLRCAQRIPEAAATLLDFGSGAGLPGIPIQIARPEIAVTLAESQLKKAAFLREVIRELDLPRASVVSGRVESLASERQFDVVTLRAVDHMDSALRGAGPRIVAGGSCIVLTSEAEKDAVFASLPRMTWQQDAVPGTRQRVILLGADRPSVSRETIGAQENSAAPG